MHTNATMQQQKQTNIDDWDNKKQKHEMTTSYCATVIQTRMRLWLFKECNVAVRHGGMMGQLDGYTSYLRT